MTDLAGWPLVAACAVFGLAFGSFANVAVHRWPLRESLGTSRSRCPHCGTPIEARDNIPLVSFLVLKGRCRHCGERISFRYPVVETLIAVIWALLAVIHGATWLLPALLLLGWALVVATVIDLEHQIIPNALTYWLAPALLLLLTGAAALEGTWGDLRRAIIVGIVLPLAMFLLSETFRILRGKQGMGLGDVKLAVSLGLVLGYLGGWETVVALYATIISAVLIAVGLMMAGRARLATRIPFGPYLAVGTLAVLLAGDPLVAFARDLVGL